MGLKMIYSYVDGERKHIRDVEKGTRGFDCWYNQYETVACKGYFRKYWKYVNDRPDLPEGYENETEWHALWKSTIKEEYCEVVCGDNRQHRADIKTPEVVIEIQKSFISYEAAKERVDFYNNLTESRVIWIVNVYYPVFKGRINIKKVPGEYPEVEWKYEKNWVRELLRLNSKKVSVYLDMSPKKDKMVKVWVHDKKMYGRWCEKSDFYNKYLKDFSYGCENFPDIFSGLDPEDYK